MWITFFTGQNSGRFQLRFWALNLVEIKYWVKRNWIEENSSRFSNCEIYLNSAKLAEGIGTNHKKAKAAASLEGLPKLQKIYYTIKVRNQAAELDLLFCYPSSISIYITRYRRRSKELKGLLTVTRTNWWAKTMRGLRILLFLITWVVKWWKWWDGRVEDWGKLNRASSSLLRKS